MAEKGFKRKLTTILSADDEGYSRIMGDAEEASFPTLTACREVIRCFFSYELMHPGIGKITRVKTNQSISQLRITFKHSVK